MYGFGKALDVLRDGDLVTRKAWEPMDSFGVQPAIKLIGQTVRPHGEGAHIMAPMLVELRPTTIKDVYVQPWAPTHGDLLAEDWETAP